MADESERLLDLIGRVADGGADIDWQALEDAAPDESFKAAIRELRTVAGVGDVHASPIADAVTTPTPGRSRAAFSTRPVVDPDDTTAALVVPRAPNTWGNFQLVRLLGEGSFGEVYEAIDTFLQHRVALKLLKPVVEQSRILHEARMLVRLRHPNVIAVHGADIHSGRIGFWMEFIDGRTLADVVARENVRSAAEAVVFGQDLLRALAAVHSVGIIHRDIKAQNVIRESGSGRIVLMDFGAGELVGSGEAARLRTAGTPLYLAPELFDGAPATRQSDIYAAGVLLFYLVTGSFPVQGTTVEDLRRAHASGRRRRLADVRPDLPDPFVRVVERMIAPDFGQRYDTASSAREALEMSVVAPATVTNNPAVAPANAVRPWVLGAATIVGIAAFAFLLGFVACRAFEVTFGVGAEFVAGPAQYFTVGRTMLIPFTVCWVGAATVAAVLRLLALSRPARHWLNRLKGFRPIDSSTAATILFLASAVGLIAIASAYSPLLSAIGTLHARAPLTAADLFVLSGGARGLYETLDTLSWVWAFVLTLSVCYWFPRLARRSTDATVVSVMKWATVVVALLTVAIPAMPRRILWEKFDVVEFAGERMFVIAGKGGNLLLFGPHGGRPVHRIVHDGPEVQRQSPELIFSSPSNQ